MLTAVCIYNYALHLNSQYAIVYNDEINVVFCFLHILQIGKNEIDFHNVVSCELRASWLNKQEEFEFEFEHTVSMIGIDKQSVTIIIDNPQGDQGE